MMGQLGSAMMSSELAASPPLRKVGPRLIVMLANQIMNRANTTHWLLSVSSTVMSSMESSGTMGVLLSTVVSKPI